MIHEVHARIHSFLQQLSVEPLHSPQDAKPDAFYNKAGLVPFVPGAERQYLVMKPVPKHAHMPPPAFQLCKGTRMYKKARGWRDIRETGDATGELEMLAVTGLREGIEELGVNLEGISRIIDLGAYTFSSAKTASPRHMWLFAAEMRSTESLLPFQAIAKITSARDWMPLSRFQAEGRDDHSTILADIEARLNKA
jgi:hypothetical protein